MTASTLKRLDATQVELEFDIPAADLEKARERAFRELSRNVKLPGFRPGKVPRKIFEANYGTQAIEERARDEVLNAAYAKALEENAIEPVERAQVEEMPTEGAEVRFRARFAIRPEVALKQYKGIAVASPPVSVSDDDVDQAMEQLRRGEAVLVPVDRPVELGDVATLDYAGSIDGAPFEGGSATNQPTEITEGRFIPGFVDGIVGMRAGETKDVAAAFPADYSNTDLAGKAAVFTVTVHDVKAPELPDLNDDFAARFAQKEAATLDELRTDVRRRLERASRNRAREAMTAELLEKIRDAHEVPLPEVLVVHEVDTMLGDLRIQSARAGLEWSEFLERAGKTEEDFRASARPDAERRVKTGLLLEAVAKAEKIQATNADVDAELASLSSQYGRPKAEILEKMRPNIQTLVDGIVRSKTIEFLIDNAQKVEATRGPAA